MSKVEEYRHNAAECERLARVTLAREDRASFLKLARDWRELADELDTRPLETRPIAARFGCNLVTRSPARSA